MRGRRVRAIRILLVNDDGAFAPGIRALSKVLSEEGHEVFVVAPEGERSAVSHAITVSNSISAQRVNLNAGEREAWAVSGTPADCVALAFEYIIGNSIDMVVSGINKGPNLGEDVFYSGTVAGAREGIMFDTPGVALSYEEFASDFAAYERSARFFVKNLLGPFLEFFRNRGPAAVLNVNFPTVVKPWRGIRVAKLARRRWKSRVSVEKTGEKVVFRMTGFPVLESGGEDLDAVALERGFVTVTPLSLYPVDKEGFEELRRILSG